MGKVLQIILYIKPVKQLLTCAWLVNSHELQEYFKCDTFMPTATDQKTKGLIESFPIMAVLLVKGLPL